MAHKSARRPLALKLLIVTELALLVAIVAMLLPVRWQMHAQAVADLQAELRSVATVAALQVPGDKLRLVRGAADKTLPEFLELRATLTKARDAAGLTQDNLYTLFRDSRGRIRFGVMTHEKPFVGDELEFHEYMRPAFEQGLPCVSPLYADEFGQWISAYAPIFASDGSLAGVLEANRPAAAYFERYNRVQNITAAIALAALAIASLLGFYVVHRVVLSPMRQVRGGVLALARQDFSHRVSLASRDEFEDLGHLLNDLSRQLNAARAIADGFAPAALPTPPGWKIAAACVPCEATAGDYFDAFTLPNGTTAVLVADVTGHGLGPSLLMSACRSALRALATTGLPPADLLDRLDALLESDLTNGRFITLFYATLAPDGTLTYCNAGHAPALLLSASADTVAPLDSHRPPLGIPFFTPDPNEPRQTTLHLSPGDRLLLTSDGLPEAHSPTGEQLGTDPMLPILRDRTLTPEALLSALRALAEKHCQGPSKTDDITLLVAQRSETTDGHR